MTDDFLDDLVDSIINREIGTSTKNPRRMNARSVTLLKAIIPIMEAAHPITGRGVGYKLFVAGLIPSMSRNNMQRVYRLLKEARERDMLLWNWIVDEGRELERTPSFNNPGEFAGSAIRAYRLDFWKQQPMRCEVWAEKGTIRGVLQPVA